MVSSLTRSLCSLGPCLCYLHVPVTRDLKQLMSPPCIVKALLLYASTQGSPGSTAEKLGEQELEELRMWAESRRQRSALQEVGWFPCALGIFPRRHCQSWSETCVNVLSLSAPCVCSLFATARPSLFATVSRPLPEEEGTEG